MYSQVPIEEQETIINIDYSRKSVILYTSKTTLMKRLTKEIGEADKVYTTKNKISGKEWETNFKDKKKLSKLISRPRLV